MTCSRRGLGLICQAELRMELDLKVPRPAVENRLSQLSIELQPRLPKQTNSAHGLCTALPRAQSNWNSSELVSPNRFWTAIIDSGQNIPCVACPAPRASRRSDVSCSPRRAPLNIRKYFRSTEPRSPRSRPVHLVDRSRVEIAARIIETAQNKPQIIEFCVK